MSKTINIKEVIHHLELMDGRAKGDSQLYRHLMSKDEDSSDVWPRSYRLGTGYNKIIGELDEGYHQYVSLALFSSPGSRTKSTIRATSGLYVDLDDSLYGGKIALDLINKTLTRARIVEPTMVIHSGGGWHLYWLFNEIYYFNNDEDIKKYEAVIWDIITTLSIIGADPKSRDAGRILRLAGTYNKKKHFETSPAVRILESRDVYYGLEDFQGLRVVKKLPQEYDSPSKEANTLTKDEPVAIKKSQAIKPSRVISQSLTRPDEDFPLYIVGDIIIDAQRELERRNHQARYMAERNQLVIVDLLINYIGLPRNTYKFKDGSAGQYILEGHRNHFLWMLSRRGVTYKHLALINRTMLLPSLNHREFNNAVGAWRTMGVPKIESMVNDLGLTLTEQSVMGALRIDYGAILDKHDEFFSTRINQLISDTNHQYVLATLDKPAKEVASDLEIAVSRVYQLRKKKGGDFMSKEQREQEVRDMYKDLEKTSRITLEATYENYIIAGAAIDKIIHNQAILHSLRVPLTREQREDLQTLADGLVSKMVVLISQLESYEEFITDDSEYFKSGKIKKTVLLNKLNDLKASTGRLVNV